MSNENTSVDTDDIDLDTFSAELFGRSEAPSEATEEETVEDAQEVDAPEDTQDEDDTLDTEETNEEEAKPAPKKNRFQERIDEVVGKQREAERKAQELEQKLQEALNRLENTKPESKPETEEATTGPNPNDTNEDGTEKYPLGEFDPNFIRDLMKHTLAEESKAQQEAAKQKEVETQRSQAEAELQQAWNEKLAPAQERYPDFIEKGEQLTAAFDGIDPAYGDYLATTIMEMEYGPDVFYHLASNPDEAKAIVESGAKKATIALGRLEARFATAAEAQARPRVSNAPPPPPANKGAAVAMPDVPDDTDDLDAFAAKLFSKRRS